MLPTAKSKKVRALALPGAQTHQPQQNRQLLHQLLGLNVSKDVDALPVLPTEGPKPEYRFVHTWTSAETFSSEATAALHDNPGDLMKLFICDQGICAYAIEVA